MPTTELRSEVEIDAPVEHVYRVLTDFERYPEWNPFLTSVTGTLVVGQKLAVDMSLPEGDAYLLEPTVTVVEPNVELRWLGSFRFKALMKAEHLFQLRAPREGVTRLMQGQNFSGLLLRFAGSSLTLAARGAVYMNLALKKRAEQTR